MQWPIKIVSGSENWIPPAAAAVAERATNKIINLVRFANLNSLAALEPVIVGFYLPKPLIGADFRSSRRTSEALN
jgi:hypothetical protein